jgi:DNA-directed RNA polymerase specialized sigma24 family protein
MKAPNVAIDTESSPNRFPTTRWSVILSCTNSEEETIQEALTELCRIYWRPIFAFVCRRGYSVPDAQDLTQDFFLMMLKGNLLSLADRCRGRFRSLVLAALKNFLIDNHDRLKTQKRGGEIQFVSWNEWMAEAPSHLSIPALEFKSSPAERIFDLRWAATVAEHALQRLGEECESRGRRRIFIVLSKYLTADRMEISYVNLSAALGVPENSIKRLLHHLRQRYRAILRDELLQTVETPGEVDDEIRYLCAALATGTPSNS